MIQLNFIVANEYLVLCLCALFVCFIVGKIHHRHCHYTIDLSTVFLTGQVRENLSTALERVPLNY